MSSVVVHTATDARAQRIWPLADGSIWTVWSSGDRLSAVRSSQGGDSTTYDLAANGEAGSLTATVCLTDDGAVWVTNNYVVARLAAKATSFGAMQLDLTVPGALAGATDQSAPLAGTWVSSMAPLSGGSILLARLNVGWLTSIGSDLKASKSADLPTAFEGARAMAADDRGIWIIPGWLDSSTTSQIGLLKNLTLATREYAGAAKALELTPAGRIPMTRAHSTTTFDTESGAVEATSSSDTYLDRWCRSVSGLQAFVDREQGVVRILDQSEVRTLELTTQTGAVAGPGGSPQPNASKLENVPDMAFDVAGQSLWILRDDGRALHRVTL